MSQKKKRKFREAPLIPDNFPDSDLCAAMNRSPEFKYLHALPLVCGLLLKLKSGLQRIYKRSDCKFPRNAENQSSPPELFELLLMFTSVPDQVRREWTIEILWSTAEALTAKNINLSVNLQRELINQPLYTPDPDTGLMRFHDDFLKRVSAYHDTVRRPEGTFDVESLLQYQSLASLPRELCPHCNNLRQVYCGPCHGKRMVGAESLLPARVSLPFDVCLLLHWNELLTRCTGIHTAVLTTEGHTSVITWLKEPSEWQRVVEDLDPNRDVLLFPGDDSIPAEDFPWAFDASITEADSDNSNSSNRPRRQLVVLEASWSYAKGMISNLITHRKALNLPPIPTVKLTDVSGEYWRFHELGKAAVSTIEAIAHAAKAAGCEEVQYNALLTLFRLQKLRVLGKGQLLGEEGSAVPHQHGSSRKKPRAVEVAGEGLGSWHQVASIPNPNSSK